jgi:hypothetical protein
VSDQTLALELQRAFAMSRLFDEMADHLLKSDFASFDRTMSKFRQVSSRENPRSLNTAAGAN